MSDLYWVGSRLADIEGVENIFAGAITLFGSSHFNLPYESYETVHGHRPNPNSFDDLTSIQTFFRDRIEEKARTSSDAIFFCYGSEWSGVSQQLRRLFPYINSDQITRLCKDKFRARSMVALFAPIAPTVCLFRVDCTFETLCSLFPGKQRFVVQSAFGSGGEGTVVVDENDCAGRICHLPGCELIASPYIDGIPINTHAVIGEDDLVIFQPSVQLIEKDGRGKLLYRGGDFAAALSLPERARLDIDETSKRVALRLQAAGYRGVLGVDYLLTEYGAIFIEINPRFQASSFVLNRHLRQQGFPSLQMLHRRAFEGGRVAVGNSTRIEASFIVFLESETRPSIPGSALVSGDYDTFGNAPHSLSPGAPIARAYFSAPIVRVNDGVIADTAVARQIGLSPSVFIHW